MPARPAKRSNADLPAAFAGLKKILQPYERRLAVVPGKPSFYCLEFRDLHHRGKPLFFAGVRRGKNYVSYHLLPIYMNPVLYRTISPALKKRMQGKACFNFSAPDPQLFAELRRLTAAGARFFRSPKLLDKISWLRRSP